MCETLYMVLGSLDMPDGCSVGWYKPQLVILTFKNFSISWAKEFRVHSDVSAEAALLDTAAN